MGDLGAALAFRVQRGDHFRPQGKVMSVLRVWQLFLPSLPWVRDKMAVVLQFLPIAQVINSSLSTPFNDSNQSLLYQRLELDGLQLP